MNKELEKFSSVAQSISLLLYPHAEVVIHDLSTGTIAAIYNNFSKRNSGDESLLEEISEGAGYPDVFPLYFKTNWDGKKIKSTSATLRDRSGKAIGLLCINLDVSHWNEMHQFILGWINEAAYTEKPKALFQEDWREKINLFVQDYLLKANLSLRSIDNNIKRELILALHKEGAFQAKNAASYIADILDLSRATVYNYLRT